MPHISFGYDHCHLQTPILGFVTQHIYMLPNIYTQHIYWYFSKMLPNIYKCDLTYISNTYETVSQHIYSLICVGHICWTYMLDDISGPLYMLGNMYICWVTCYPTYISCYLTYIGVPKCHSTYIKSYMMMSWLRWGRLTIELWSIITFPL